MKKGAAFLAGQSQQNDAKIFVIFFSVRMMFFREKRPFKKGTGGEKLSQFGYAPVRITSVAPKAL